MKSMKMRTAALLLVVSLALCGCSKDAVVEEYDKIVSGAKEEYSKASDRLEKEASEEVDLVVKDNHTLKFVVTHHALAESGNYILTCNITNKQENPLIVKVDTTEIDGVKAYPDWSVTLQPGEEITADVDTLLGLQATEDDVHEVHFHIVLVDGKTSEEIFQHGYKISINSDSPILHARDRLLYIEFIVPDEVFKNQIVGETYKSLFQEDYFVRIDDLGDGTKSYKMTREQYRDYHDKVKTAIFSVLEAGDFGDYYSRRFPHYEYDDELTHFTVTSNYNYQTLDEDAFAMILALSAELYHSVSLPASLQNYDDTSVEFVYEPTGEPYYTYHSNTAYRDF